MIKDTCIKQSLTVVLVVICQLCAAQKNQDTAAIISAFNRVMEFAVQPDLYYTSTTSMHSIPAIRIPGSTPVLHNVFYKVNNDLYYGNEQEEVYLQDSLMITINHIRKTILINKVDVATKEKMDLMPLKKASMQKMLREHFVISQQQRQGDTLAITIHSHDRTELGNMANTEMVVLYSKPSYLPYAMQVTQQMRQPASEQLLAVLNSQGLMTQTTLTETQGVKYIYMSQTATINFSAIETSGKKSKDMPVWKNSLSFDEQLQSFKGTNKCAEYEVTQNF